MTKRLIAGLAVLTAFSSWAHADAKQELLNYLANNTSFVANFKLVATDPKGKVLNQQQGEIKGQRPTNLYLHTSSPTENYVTVYNGEVTYYDPFVEQVTISKLEQSQPMPFVYLLDNTSQAWAQAQVSKKGSCYQVVDPQLQANYKYLQACIVNGALTEFSYQELNGNKATYTFTNYRTTSLGAKDFTLTYPSSTLVVRK
ncbi:outer membrane lipoprotein carrier protein LolA [Psittacicella melopsittaci]|uniref:Outer-membrane lipoprotein carrier protein n=1 Tax=Psittacicella melopsittaci TaxID=2028576 RepID=A0A3A1Y357_9GAMM|nr:outer membrane lipoprotein chaperone LolA [Psittacicella melopsittaci]RIY32663.1 outer membrane lipoprotein carrier protein LolA [Psittacicella melopsittaci]